MLSLQSATAAQTGPAPAPKQTAAGAKIKPSMSNRGSKRSSSAAQADAAAKSNTGGTKKASTNLLIVECEISSNPDIGHLCT